MVTVVGCSTKVVCSILKTAQATIRTRQRAHVSPTKRSISPMLRNQQVVSKLFTWTLLCTRRIVISVLRSLALDQAKQSNSTKLSSPVEASRTPTAFLPLHSSQTIRSTSSSAVGMMPRSSMSLETLRTTTCSGIMPSSTMATALHRLSQASVRFPYLSAVILTTRASPQPPPRLCPASLH